MSDQMPDEVWVDEHDVAWNAGDGLIPGDAVRYIRADLYEQAGEFDCQGIDPADLGQHFTDAMQALTTRNAVSKAACAQLIAEQAQRAEQAEADRMKAWEHLQRTQQRLQLVEAELAQSSRAWHQWAVEIEAERDMYKAGLDQHGAYLAAANKELTKAEAKHDRLRAALADIADDPYDYQRVQDKAQEALDHAG